MLKEFVRFVVETTGVEPQELFNAYVDAKKLTFGAQRDLADHLREQLGVEVRQAEPEVRMPARKAAPAPVSVENPDDATQPGEAQS